MKDERDEQKHPREMTSDELLDYVIAPEIAEKLRERVRDDPPPACEDSQE